MPNFISSCLCVFVSLCLKSSRGYHRAVCVALVILCSACLSGEPTPAPPAASTYDSGRRIIGYFAAWNARSRKYVAKNIADSGSAEKLTHLNYAFANISNELTCILGNAESDIHMAFDAALSVDGIADDTSGLRGNFNQLRKLKLRYPHLKILISIGGWSWSSKFSDASLSAESRKKFAASAIELFIKGHFAPGIQAPGIFDGIDLDWEYPGAAGATKNFRAEDKENFTALLAEFRALLDAQTALDKRQYLLTIASGAGNGVISKLEVEKISKLLDFINIMAYDMHGSWDKTTNFHAPLFPATDDPSRSRSSADTAVQLFLNAGAPPEKLVIGLPFYAHGWKGVEPGPKGDGLFQPTGGNATGGNGFRQLKDAVGFEKHHHPETKAFWIYSAEKKVFWSLDDPDSIATKMNYIREKKLGGAMFWEISQDDEKGTLIEAIAKGLK